MTDHSLSSRMRAHQGSRRLRPTRLLHRAGHLLGGALVLAVALAGQPAMAAHSALATPDRGPRHATALAAAFDTAAARYGVPRDLLAALGYAETHLDGHAGAPSAAGGYGVMHLTSNPQVHTLDKAAALTGLDREALRTDIGANITGAAAVLRSYAEQAGLSAAQRRDLNRWYEVVARYGGSATPAVARLYADTVYDLLATGFTAQTAAGTFAIAGQPVAPQRGELADVAPVGAEGDIGIQSTDYPPANWVPAYSGNYTTSNRESTYPINFVIIHTAQGSYSGTISWFQNPSANVSAHYVIRSSDGDVTQMVRDKDIAWHAGNWDYNTRSIGIEHEGFVNDASWYTDAMYRSSAALTKYMCDKWGIPKDRAHIIGHNEVPGATHTDPGPNWDWTYYMQLVTGSTSSWSTIVDNSDPGFFASANWGVSSWSSQRYSADYRYANPAAVSDAGWYRVDIPATATYRVDVWYPANSGYNDATPYVIVTPTGNQVVHVNQRINGGRWVSLGIFTLAAGYSDKVAVSRWTNGTGYVIADAIRITRV